MSKIVSEACSVKNILLKSRVIFFYHFCSDRIIIIYMLICGLLFFILPISFKNKILGFEIFMICLKGLKLNQILIDLSNLYACSVWHTTSNKASSSPTHNNDIFKDVFLCSYMNIIFSSNQSWTHVLLKDKLDTI